MGVVNTRETCQVLYCLVLGPNRTWTSVWETEPYASSLRNCYGMGASNHSQVRHRIFVLKKSSPRFHASRNLTSIRSSKSATLPSSVCFAVNVIWHWLWTFHLL